MAFSFLYLSHLYIPNFLTPTSTVSSLHPLIPPPSHPSPSHPFTLSSHLSTLSSFHPLIPPPSHPSILSFLHPLTPSTLSSFYPLILLPPHPSTLSSLHPHSLHLHTSHIAHRKECLEMHEREMEKAFQVQEYVQYIVDYLTKLR